MEESKLERSAVRSLLLLSREENLRAEVRGEIDRWEPLKEFNLNVTAKPPRPQSKRPRKQPLKPTPEPQAPSQASTEPLVPLQPSPERLMRPTLTPDPVNLTMPTPEPPSYTPLPEAFIQTTDSRESSVRPSRRTSVDLSVVQMPPPIHKSRRTLQTYRNSPISVAPIPRPLSLSVRDVQRALSENTRKYRVGSHERRLVKLRGRLSFRSYVALKS